MSVDLGNYLDNLKREVNPPGVDLFPASGDDEWTGRLGDAFWQARIEGIQPLLAYSCDDNSLVTPLAVSTPELGRDLVQLVILYASFTVIRNSLANVQSQFKASAGNVSIDIQRSALLMRDVMADIVARKNIILTRLSDVGSVPTLVVDAITARDEAIVFGFTTWVGQSVDPHSRGAAAGIGFGP